MPWENGALVHDLNYLAVTPTQTKLISTAILYWPLARLILKTLLSTKTEYHKNGK